MVIGVSCCQEVECGESIELTIGFNKVEVTGDRENDFNERKETTA